MSLVWSPRGPTTRKIVRSASRQLLVSPDSLTLQTGEAPAADRAANSIVRAGNCEFHPLPKRVALTTTARVLLTLATLSTASASRHQRAECLSSCSFGLSFLELTCVVNASDFRADCLEGTVRFLSVEGLPREDGDLTPTPSIRLEASFFGNATRLRRIVFSRIRISELDPSTFFAFPELKTLKLARTCLQQLPEDLLSRAPKLRLFEMRFNDVTSLPEKVFSRNPSLSRVNLSRNRLTSLPEDLFVSNHELEHVKLSGNRLTSLPPGLFANKTELRWLRLSSNSLTALPEDSFKDNPNLLLVDLDDNRLISVSSETFAWNGVEGMVLLAGNPVPCDCPFRDNVTRLSEKGWSVQLPDDCRFKTFRDCTTQQLTTTSTSV